MASFYGVTKWGQTTHGVNVCLLIACVNDTISSCGHRMNTTETGVLFNSISVKTTVPKESGIVSMPSTLRSDLQPVANYYFCEKEVDNKIEVTIQSNTYTDSLLTFGIFGRVFHNDGKPEGPRNHGTLNYTKMHLIVVLSVILFLPN